MASGAKLKYGEMFDRGDKIARAIFVVIVGKKVDKVEKI